MIAHSLIAQRLLGLSLAAALASAGAAACAGPAPFNPSDLPSAQLSQMGEICQAVMGIPAGFSLKTACVESLSTSLAALGQGRGLQGAQGACLGKGLRPGEPALAECELTAASTQSATTGLPIDAAPPARPVKSYFYASQREIHRREETACARLGYEPVYGSFAACVARLDSALFDAEHVAH
jgi:hypothetical protein